MKLELKDSQYIESNLKSKSAYTAFYCQAIDKLNIELKDEKIEFLLLGGIVKEIDNNLIWYKIISTKEVYNNYATISEATFFTSHYIGFYSTKVNNTNVDIFIRPRFGEGIFNHLLSYAYGIYLPKGTSSTNNEKSNNLWLIAIMWKATLQKAMTKSQIPKEYQKIEKNLSTFKGQLNISKHIKHNLFDKSKFYCSYRKLTMNTTINQTIRYVYKLLEKKGFGNLLKDIAEYDQMLQSFGVESKNIHQDNIQNIRYSRLNIYYKKVMELSSLILKSQSKSSDSRSNNNDSFSYFLDIAELWENYLLKVLQRNLPEYNIYSPNDEGGEYLFEKARQIIPDIIIKKDDKVIAILDAKYKSYTKVGKFSNSITHPNNVSRDDLYQMSTYLYHYADRDSKVLGLFISPVQGEEIKNLQNNKNHHIGVLGLDIKQFEDSKEFKLDDINEEEQKFINKLKRHLTDSL